MRRDDLPEDVRYFLQTSIDSIEQLQVLLLLQAQPDRIWTTSEITFELRSVDSSIQNRLDKLYKRNILARHGDSEHKFLPTSTEMLNIIEKVVSENQLRPYQIIDAIYSSAEKSIQDFANAFKMRGDKS